MRVMATVVFNKDTEIRAASSPGLLVIGNGDVYLHDLTMPVIRRMEVALNEVKKELLK
jgi:hypothetical protein